MLVKTYRGCSAAPIRRRGNGIGDGPHGADRARCAGGGGSPLGQRELAPRQRARLEMVKAAWLGADIAAIAQWSGRTPRPVRRWLTTFRDGGVAALAGAPIPGRPRRPMPSLWRPWRRRWRRRRVSLGVPVDGWTSRRLSAYLLEQTGVRLAPGWLRVLLHRQCFAGGRPKHTLDHLQDPAEVAACEEALVAAGEKGGGRSGAR